MPSSTSPPSSSSTQQQWTHHDLPDELPCFSCVGCSTKICPTNELVSKAFSGREGRAFLVNTCVNVIVLAPETRLLSTGRHTVADVVCRSCDARIGWKYKKAEEVGQRYKEGKFIIERERVVKENGWELELEEE